MSSENQNQNNVPEVAKVEMPKNIMKIAPIANLPNPNQVFSLSPKHSPLRMVIVILLLIIVSGVIAYFLFMKSSTPALLEQAVANFQNPESWKHAQVNGVVEIEGVPALASNPSETINSNQINSGSTTQTQTLVVNSTILIDSRVAGAEKSSVSLSGNFSGETTKAEFVSTPDSVYFRLINPPKILSLDLSSVNRIWFMYPLKNTMPDISNLPLGFSSNSLKQDLSQAQGIVNDSNKIYSIIKDSSTIREVNTNILGESKTAQFIITFDELKLNNKIVELTKSSDLQDQQLALFLTQLVSVIKENGGLTITLNVDIATQKISSISANFANLSNSTQATQSIKNISKFEEYFNWTPTDEISVPEGVALTDDQVYSLYKTVSNQFAGLLGSQNSNLQTEFAVPVLDQNQTYIVNLEKAITLIKDKELILMNDAKLKEQLALLRAQAELKLDPKGLYPVTLCTTTLPDFWAGVKILADQTSITCNVSQDRQMWISSVKLSDGSKFCVDSKGFANILQKDFVGFDCSTGTDVSPQTNELPAIQDLSILTQAQAEALVLEKYGACVEGECGGRTVMVKKNKNKQFVVTIITGALDDSVASYKDESIATNSNGKWVLGKPIETFACQRSHSDGSKGFTASLCN